MTQRQTLDKVLGDLLKVSPMLQWTKSKSVKERGGPSFWVYKDEKITYSSAYGSYKVLFSRRVKQSYRWRRDGYTGDYYHELFDCNKSYTFELNPVDKKKEGNFHYKRTIPKKIYTRFEEFY